jgi:hypothetical protein
MSAFAPIGFRIAHLIRLLAPAFLAVSWMLSEPIFASKPALEIPLLGDPPRTELENSFPPRSDDPDTAYFRGQHCKKLEKWRKTKLEPIVRKLDKYATELDAVDHDLEIKLATQAVTEAEYAALRSQLATAKKQLQHDAEWNNLYQEYVRKYKADSRACNCN